ncbi:MAG: hypothetical protein GX945_08660 [Lentisphaerae bacterium]|nr:hypothetical protein [Lentisphaerota bacterium]
MKQIYKVNIATGINYECLGASEIALAIGDEVVVRCERYLDFGTVCSVSDELVEDEAGLEKKRAQHSKGRHIEGQKIPQILRKATDEDKNQALDNRTKALEAHKSTQERIRAHRLDMKLIHTHYAFDRKLLLFQFSAEGRVDFRELLRDLSSLFRIRVELRQIGVRDEAAILGGIGTCGRPFCCASFLPSFNSINVKMAKQQGLSLNPQNISGTCGRLKCCLQYEAEAYRQAAAELKAQQQQAASNKDDKQGESDNEGDSSKQQPQTAGASQKSPQGARSNRRNTGNRSGEGGRGNRGNRPPGQRRQRSSGPLPPRNPNKAPLPPVSDEGAAATPAPKQADQPGAQSPTASDGQS